MLAGVVLLSLAAVVCICLFLPLEVALRLGLGSGIKFNILLSWLSGVLKKELRWKSHGGAVERLTEGGYRFENTVQLFSSILRIKGLPAQFLHLIGNCLKRLKMKEFVARLQIGLDNPADTGLLFAYLSPLSLLGLVPLCKIELEPSFGGDVIVQGYLSAKVEMKPAWIVLPVISFIFSSPVIKGWGRLVLNIWRRRSKQRKLCPSVA